ncbi:hypothetical protein EXIGLDRAFT_736364 [Exidia glandulosa HHB12029]|uniref:Uncharacterized protein n=1 Tax=Exidia glandulosa HHB12029 TaxID=1314781 RepID=A0A165JFA8_EXIGL|nr:hypothetical protein EXIGLDRAFT_736364 [Exidia glandulosa HHB12029]
MEDFIEILEQKQGARFPPGSRIEIVPAAKKMYPGSREVDVGVLALDPNSEVEELR